MSLTTGKSFLENKCGYSQCVNMVEDGGDNYVNLGGFIFMTKACEQHTESLLKFIIATNRAIYRDSVCHGIMTETFNDLVDNIQNIIKSADEMMPYPQQQSFSDNPPIDKASVYVPDKNEPKTRPLNKKKEGSEKQT